MKTYDSGFEDNEKKVKRKKADGKGAKKLHRYLATLSGEQVQRMMDDSKGSYIGSDPTAQAIYRKAISGDSIKIQAQLEVSQPNDAAEMQANKVAEAVSQGNMNLSRMTVQQQRTEISMKGEGGTLTTSLGLEEKGNELSPSDRSINYDDKASGLFGDTGKISYEEALIENFFDLTLGVSPLRKFSGDENGKNYLNTKQRFALYPSERLQVMKMAWMLRPRAQENFNPSTDDYSPFDQPFLEVNFRDTDDYKKLQKKYEEAGTSTEKSQIISDMNSLERETDIINRKLFEAQSVKKVIAIKMRVDGEEYETYYFDKI